MGKAGEHMSQENDRLLLSSWGLPKTILEKYEDCKITRLFEWQADCLCTGNALAGGNLVYCAPTSAGKTMVAELLMLKRVVETHKKAIMILPFVSVAREKMLYLQSMFGDAGVNVDGYIGGENPSGGFSSVSIAVCTIEKANGLINRLFEEKRIDDLGMVVVDELHMVGDSHRGYLLELMLTKLRFVVNKNKTKQSMDASLATSNSIQIVGMSATLPNLDLLAKWLDADLYSTDYRPVPLTEMVKIGNDIFDNNLRKLRTINSDINFFKDDEQIVQLCLETIFERCSVLIFCPTKAWCETLADTIAREFYRLIREPLKRNTSGPPAIKVDIQALNDVCEQLRRTPVGIDPYLAKTVPQGVAFHHAGLTFDERDIVEGSFRNGSLKVLVATSTLSSGVNLPARRVIVRTPTFHGTLIDVLTYKQMIGRAGRKGVDVKGESILVCKSNEKAKAEKLVNCTLPPVRSCLQQSAEFGLTSSMKRAILEVVVSGVANTPTDVKAYANSTMLAASMIENENDSISDSQSSNKPVDAIETCIQFLKYSEFIILRKVQDSQGKTIEKFVPTQLGTAVLASALSPDEGLVVFRELQKARKCFVLENELHIIYLVTPIYMVLSTIEWYDYLCMWENLPSGMKRVSELVGVSESFLSKAVRGKIPKHTAEHERIFGIHKRFFTSMVLNDLVNEMSLGDVCKKYKCNRGTLQSLQQSAATFAGMVTVFCRKLGWLNLEMLLSQFQSRLTFGVQRELIDLVRVGLLNGQRARVMYNGGFQTVANLANADPVDIEILLKNSAPFMSKKRGEGETEWEAEERKKSHCIWLTGKKGVTEYEAAVMIVEEAKFWLQRDLLEIGVEWKPEQDKSTKDKKDKETVNISNKSISKPQKKKRRSSFKDMTNISLSRSTQPNTNVSILSPPPSFLKRKSSSEKSDCSSVKKSKTEASSEVNHTKQEQKSEIKTTKRNLQRKNVKASQKDLSITEKVFHQDPLCLFNVSGELDLTCLSCESPNVSRKQGSTKKYVQKVNTKLLISEEQLRLSNKNNDNNAEMMEENLIATKTISSSLEEINNEAEHVTENVCTLNKHESIRQQIGKVSNEVFPIKSVNTSPSKEKSKNAMNGNMGNSVPKAPNTIVQAKSPSLALNTVYRENSPGNQDLKEFTVDTQTLKVMTDMSGSWLSQENGDVYVENLEKSSQRNVDDKHVPTKDAKPNQNIDSPPLFSEDFDVEYPSPSRKVMIRQVNDIALSASPNLLHHSLVESPELIPASAFDRAAFDDSLLDFRNSEDVIDDNNENQETGNLVLVPDRQSMIVVPDLKTSHSSSTVTKKNYKKQNVDSYTWKKDNSCSSIFDELNSVEFENSMVYQNDQKVDYKNISTEHLTSSKKDERQEYVSEVKHLSIRPNDDIHLTPGTVALLNDFIDEGHFDSFSKNSFTKGDKCNIPESKTQKRKLADTVKGSHGKEGNTKRIQSLSRSSITYNSRYNMRSNKQEQRHNLQMNDSCNTSVSDNNVSDCLPPTPTKSENLEDNTKAGTPSRLIGGTGKTPNRTQKLLDEGNSSQKISLRTPRDKLVNNSSIFKTSTPCVDLFKVSCENVENSFILDTSLPSTNQSFTIIDVCSNSALFDMFVCEWKNQKNFSISLACEKLPKTKSSESSGIGSNFSKPKKNPGTAVPVRVDGLILEEEELVIIGLAVSWGKRDAYFIAFTEETILCDMDESLAPPSVDKTILVKDRILAVKKVLEGKSCVSAFDIKNHYKVLYMTCGIVLTSEVQDPKVADWILDPGAKEKTVHRMVHNYLPLEVHLLDGIGGGIGVGSIGMNPENPGSGRLRSCVESVLVHHLTKYYEVELTEQNLFSVYKDIETSTQVILGKMELNGMGFCIDECSRQKKMLLDKLTLLEEQAYVLAGHDFSLSSSSDISQVLFTEIRLPPSGDPANPGFLKTLGPARRPLKGKVKQQYSTSKDVLEKLKPHHPLPGIILEWRKITNTLSKVVFPLQNEKSFCNRLQMYRIHGLSQTHTSTGRVSMQEPNLQNIPKDFEISSDKEVKKFNSKDSKHANASTLIRMRHVFIPFEGGVILAADYSQLELRIIAHLSKDKQMTEILNSGVDVFKTIAAKWKGLSVGEVTSVQRQQAKQICYGILYGIGSKALGEQLGVDENEASVFIDTFKSRFSGIRNYLRETVKMCRDNGYVETILKRRRYLPAIKDTNMHARAHAERQAVNTSVQGSAADLVKKAMIDIDKDLMQFSDCKKSHMYFHSSEGKRSTRQMNSSRSPRGAYFILQLHDELIYEVNQRDLDKVKDIVKHRMENAIKLSVVLPVKINVGSSWGSLQEVP